MAIIVGRLLTSNFLNEIMIITQDVQVSPREKSDVSSIGGGGINYYRLLEMITILGKIVEIHPFYYYNQISLMEKFWPND